jgi:hypothetical protein
VFTFDGPANYMRALLPLGLLLFTGLYFSCCRMSLSGVVKTRIAFRQPIEERS